MSSWWASAVAADDADKYAQRVNTLADRWVEQVEERFPIAYLGSGYRLTVTTRSTRISRGSSRPGANSLQAFERELAAIPEDRLMAGRSG